MITPYVFVAFWMLCGGVAWKIATNRGGRGQLWTVIGQLLGPFSIPLAFLVRARS